MHGCVIGGRARERENMDTRAYNMVSRACVGGCGETCGRGCKVGVCGLYVIVRWMERMRGRMWGEWRMREGGKCGKRIEGEDEMWEMEMNGMGYWGWDEGE